MQKMKMQTPGAWPARIEQLAQIFPNCVTEKVNGQAEKAIDFDALRQELTPYLLDGPQERYHLNWPGKRQAQLEASTQVTHALRPQRGESLHFDSTKNLFVEGDNLKALKILLPSLLGRIKMIYIDPPYNTGQDFIYKDSFASALSEYKQSSGQKNVEGEALVANLEGGGRFHSNWCSMMHSRLKVARHLLRDDGVVFISIDDNEVHNLRKICDEVFGPNNFLGCAGRVTKKSNNKGQFWAPNLDYVLTYGRSKNAAQPFSGGVNHSAYNLIETEGPRKGEKYQLVRLYMSTIRAENPNQRFWIKCPDGSHVMPPGSTFPPERPRMGDGIWRWTKNKFDNERDKIVIKKVKSSNLITHDGSPAKYNVFTKTYLNDVLEGASAKPNSLIETHINQKGTHEMGQLDIPFDYAKPSSLIKYLMEVAQVKKDDIILDFFAGSGTTAHAVMQLNAEDGGHRRFIMVQLDEKCDKNSAAFKAGYKTIADIARERIRRAGKKIQAEIQEANKSKMIKATRLHAEAESQASSTRQLQDKNDKASPKSITTLNLQNQTVPPKTVPLFDTVQSEDESQKKTNLKTSADPGHLDVGFRSFKLDTSNMNEDFYAPPSQLTHDVIRQQMLAHIKSDRSPEDLLYQAMIELGVPFTSIIEERQILNQQVFFVRDETDENKKGPVFRLIACMSRQGGVSRDLIFELIKFRTEAFVFCEDGFVDDEVKVNVDEIFRHLSRGAQFRVL